MSKYDALFEFLKSRTADQWQASFDDIEKVLGFELPRSAREYPAWWANQNPPMSQTRAWMEAGWLVTDLNLTGKRLLFQRTRSCAPQQFHRPGKSKRQNPTQIVRTETEQVLEIAFSWRDLGNLSLDGKKLLFPAVPNKAGLYRFSFNRDNVLSVYIGETVNLQQRLQHYRTPGPSQQTNIRINQLLTSILQTGNVVTLSVIFGNGKLIENRISKPWNLTQKAQRRLIENAAVVLAESAGAKVLNL